MLHVQWNLYLNYARFRSAELEGYRSLWDTSYVPSTENKQQNKQEKGKGLEELSQKFNLSPGYL